MPIDYKHYPDRRRLTDLIHQCVATKLYKDLNWKVWQAPEDDDISRKIDYYAEVPGQQIYSVQERFRQRINFNDFTLRYVYPANQNPQTHDSEWFKIESDLMVYGILDKQVKEFDEITTANRFLKLAIVDLRLLQKYINEGHVRVGTSKTSHIGEDGIFYTGFNQNVKRANDNQSTFVSFDIPQLIAFDPNLVIVQKGFAGLETFKHVDQLVENAKVL